MTKPFKRRIKITLGIILAIWLLTLGPFYTRYIKVSDTVNGTDARTLLDNGDLRIAPFVVVGVGQTKEIGVPFICYASFDKPPYSLRFNFIAHADEELSRIILDEVLITYDNGTASQLPIPEHGHVIDFNKEEWSNGSLYLAARTPFPDALKKRRNCTISFHGRLESQEGMEPYHEEVELNIENESYLHIGWYEFLLYLAFG